MKKSIVSLITIVILVVHMLPIAFADDGDLPDDINQNSTNCNESDSNMGSVNTFLFSDPLIDNSNMIVDVYQNNGTTSTLVYHGALSNYDNGFWIHFDFEKFGYVGFFNWNGTSQLGVTIVPSFTSVGGTDSVEGEDISGVQSLSLNPDDQNVSIHANIRINNVNVGEDGIRIVDNGTLVCSFDAFNHTNEIQTIAVILTTYNQNGVLNAVRLLGIECDAYQNKNEILTYDFDAFNETTGKIMYWNSAVGMMPIKSSLNFSKTSGVNAYHYDLNNRLRQIDKLDGSTIYFQYDKMGNLIGRGGDLYETN